MKNNKSKHNQYGSGLFDIFKEKLMPNEFKEYGEIMGSAIQSENLLIDAYEKYTRSAKQYYGIYNKHLENLKQLEDAKNIPSLIDMFKNKVMSDDFKYKISIDRSNPLLLNNYLVTDDTLPKNFKKEHVINQIRYTVSKFNPTDKILIDSIGNVSIDGTTCAFTVKTGTDEKFNLSTKINTDYVIDMYDVEEQIREIISKIKGKLDFDIELIDDFNVDTEELEIPGITYDKPEDIDALDAKLKELDFVKSIKANRSSKNNNILENKPEITRPERKEYNIFAKADAKNEEQRLAYEEEQKRLELLNKEALRDIGADVELNPEEYKKQFPEVAEQLKNIFTENNTDTNIYSPEQIQTLQQLQQQPNYPMITFGQQLPVPKFLQQQPFNYSMMGPQNHNQGLLYQQPNITQDDSYCRSMSSNPEACKIDPKCFYNANIINPALRCQTGIK